ncbi:MAG: nucleotidyltransferase [Clostridia bacterium]|nr:nucleotidyltransferase [Clostridia bacterium]
MTLVVLAAGMGSRYGGLKQIDPLGPGGEFIIDYSIYDAVRAGFDRVVFIIKKENLQIFEETVGARVKNAIEVRYAFQDINDIPAGYTVPAGRVKPWGTAHALLCAKDAVGGDNFAVINSDDFYGQDSYNKIASFLKNVKNDGKQHYCMCGFILKNTLSENGHVARGICLEDENHMLTSITERTKIQRNNGMTQFYEEETGWTDVSEDSIVSMNMWGFTASFFDEIAKRECAFFDHLKNPQKDEFLLPVMVSETMKDGAADVTVLQTMAKWYGVTYHEDKAAVQKFIADCIADNVYPGGLWK